MSSGELEELTQHFSSLSYERRREEYRNKDLDDQHRRRTLLLSQQKASRRDHTNRLRKLISTSFNQNDTGMEGVSNDHLQIQQGTAQTNQEVLDMNQQTLQKIDEMENVQYTKQTQKQHKLIEKYKDNLMVFEELSDIPEDLETNWICVPVPAGRRCLLISSQKNTMSRLKNGSLIENFKSLLPGGGGKKDPQKDYCLLDCILSDQNLTYYVLDLMVWRGQMYYDCETEFRFFWVQSKLSEEDGLDEISNRNQLKIVSLPRFSCDKKSLQDAAKKEYPFTLAGYLFYHKQAYYTFDSTPLACSVSIQMLDKILEKTEI